MDKSYKSAVCNRARALAQQRFNLWIKSHSASDPPELNTLVVERKGKLLILESIADQQSGDIKHLHIENTRTLFDSKGTTVIRAYEAKKGVIYRLYGRYRKVRCKLEAEVHHDGIFEVEPELEPQFLDSDTLLEVLEKNERFMRTADIKLGIIAKEQYGERDKSQPTMHIQHNLIEANPLCLAKKIDCTLVLRYDDFKYKLEHTKQPFCMNCLKFFRSRGLENQITLSTHEHNEIPKLKKRSKK